MGIVEIDAKKILTEYEGANNQLLEWKYRLLNNKNFSLSRNQSDYVLKYHDVVPKVARKHIKITKSFGEKLMEEKLLVKPVEQIWCEKLLCETDKAYHILGKIVDTQKNHTFWIPKGAVIAPEKELKREIDFSKYSHRPLMKHQELAVKKLLANDKYILALDMGTGKGLWVEEMIMTPRGKTRIGDIKVGDRVIGRNGKPCTVTGVYPQGYVNLFKIFFDDKTSIVADDNHLFTLERKIGDEVEQKTLSVKQLRDEKTRIDFLGIKGLYNWYVPLHDPIEFENEVETPIDPYFLGLFLSCGYVEGYKAYFVVKAKHRDEIFKNYKAIFRRAASGNESLLHVRIDDELKEKLEEIDLSGCIPGVYLTAPMDVRLSLIRGLMDGGGMADIGSGVKIGISLSIKPKRKDGIKNLVELIHTMGGLMITKQKDYTKQFTYRLVLPKEIRPFGIESLNDGWQSRKASFHAKHIKKIHPLVKRDQSVCISVDSEDKLYVMDKGIVTHNTTASVVAALESKVKKILVVCPASLKLNWKREIENYTDRRVMIVEGGKWGSTFDFYIINYDILKNYHSIDKSLDYNDYNLIENEKFDLAIIDEAHTLSNATSQRSKIMNDILKTIPKVWLLTGTPMTSRPINYYNLLKIVDSPVALNWQHYVKRYCRGYKFKVNGRTIWNTSGSSNLDELRERTQNITLRLLKSDIMDLPEKIISPIYLEMKSTFYNEEIEEYMRITKEEKGKETITSAINRLMKIRQVISYEKIPYTCEIIDKYLEMDKKVIVFTNFTMTLDMLHEKYGKKAVVLDGRMSKEKRDVSVSRFQNDDKVKVFIANIIAGGVGLNLTAAEAVIMNDLSFVPAHHDQAEDRSYRYGQKKNVQVYYPIFENTIEMIVYNILQKKRGIINQVMGDSEHDETFMKELYRQLV